MWTRRVLLPVVGLLAAGGVVAGLVVGLGGDGPEDAVRAQAQGFLDAWARGDAERAAAHTDDPVAAGDLLGSVQRNLQPTAAALRAGDPAETREKGQDGTSFEVPLAMDFTLPDHGHWRYASSALVKRRAEGEGWTVHWTPRLLHPRLRAHETLVLTRQRAERAPVLAADGTPLAADERVWHVSVWPAKVRDAGALYGALDALDAGIDIPALKKRVAAAGGNDSVPVVTLRDDVFQPHRATFERISGLQYRDATQPVARHARALVGTVTPGTTDKGASGLQARYDGQLRARPATEIVTAHRETGQPVATLAERAAGTGKPVRTTIDIRVQQAAEAALDGLAKPAAIVALDPRNGHVLAVADNPLNGPGRALTGRYPPGSTFKIVTSAALAGQGVAAGSAVECPKYATVNGQRFENQDEFQLPLGTTFRQVFAQSCNTAFVGLRSRLADGSLTETAKAFGIGGEWKLGAASFDGSVPAARSENEKAADMIGQGRVEAGPLVMASVAATVKAGAFHQPVLVPDAVSAPYRAPARLPAATLTMLRSLMREVVVSGSGRALRPLPGEPRAKTGTAEFGAASPPRTHAWLTGYLGGRDLAFCVLIEDGGSGGRDAGPVAAEFLRGIG
ncbi:penicillin-binding transpeptidase domain-containing protein [Streptomyces sp. NPDC051940]|uniref:penicillin-binding transpeptidase domain-containing protein n=1 Tax=Streptomyces sp. NPDC051940 TaxID=3155675 RepID=UPI003437E817